MGPPSYMRSVVDRKVVMRQILVLIHECLAVQRVRVTDQALPIHCSASNLPTVTYYCFLYNHTQGCW